MPDLDDVHMMCALFRGRLDAYGTDSGGCDKVTLQHVAEPAGLVDFEAEYRRRMTAHLVGSTPFGTYPLTADHLVRWGCTDLDYVDKPIQAGNLAKLLRKAGVNAWVETSRSKGYHVWSFSYEWVPAETMRNAFLACHQLLNLPAKEVNPKQVALDGLTFGNYVRTPYPGCLAFEGGYTSNKRQMMHDLQTGHVIGMSAWVEQAMAERSPARAYEKVASRYVPPPPPQHVDIDIGNRPLAAIAAKLDRGGFLAYKYGPREGFDRSGSLARLAHLSRSAGLTAGEAYAILQDADARWGKYSERPDCEEQLMKLITKAYQ